ncbi:MAG: AraC family ligand binding domain-containing protein [Enterobacteriaceae bacterium]
MFFQTESLCGSIKSVKHTYQHGIKEPVHSHQVSQLLHIITGVIQVYADSDYWIVPPSRGLWIPAGIPHSLVSVGTVEVRTLFIEPLARADLPNACGIFQVTPLLRELIITASEFPEELARGSREERIQEVILDELRLVHFTHM